MSVERICQRNVDTARPDESIVQAAERMHQHSVGCLVVVDPLEKPVGIVTDRDLAIRAVATARDAFTTTVRDVMTPEPQVVLQGTSLESALSTMRAGGFRRLPLIDGQGRLAGVITVDDILMFMAQDFDKVRRILKRETPQAAAKPLG